MKIKHKTVADDQKINQVISEPYYAQEFLSQESILNYEEINSEYKFAYKRTCPRNQYQWTITRFGLLWGTKKMHEISTEK